MKNEGIKRTETYTENKAACYRLPNTTTMENLSMQITAGEGAVLKMGDKVLVKDTDYTLSFENNDKVGTAHAVVTAKDGSGYAGTVRAAFTIKEAPKAPEYTITKGSDFQFILPTTTHNDGSYAYNVNAFDISKHDMAHANCLRPSYKETSDSVVIFRPHCNAPSPATTADNYIEDYSDYSNVGAYTFMAAVHDQSRYDAMRIKVNVVEGEPFQITNVKMTNLPSYSLGREITFTWNPCTQLYGKDSKVRILFSDDFGKTFKYAL